SIYPPQPVSCSLLPIPWFALQPPVLMPLLRLRCDSGFAPKHQLALAGGTPWALFPFRCLEAIFIAVFVIVQQRSAGTHPIADYPGAHASARLLGKKADDLVLPL